MLLRPWLSRLRPYLSPQYSRLRRRIRTQHEKREAQFATASSMGAVGETLEDRILLTNLTWVGDVDSSWDTDSSGDTNWSDDFLPSDGDTLVFDGATPGGLNNATGAGQSYILRFDAGGYSVSGDSVSLDIDGTDIINSAGTNTLSTPLAAGDGAVVDVSSGSLVIDGALSGTGDLEKVGAGDLTVSDVGEFSGTLTVSSGRLLASGVFGDGAVLSVDNDAALNPGGASATGSANVDGLTLTADSTLEIELGGTAAGATSGGYDQLNISGTAALNGSLQITLADGFVPQDGDTFDILTFGNVSGNFTSATGLFASGDDNYFFEVVEQSDRLQLVTHDLLLLNQVDLIPELAEANDSVGQFFNYDYFGFSADQFEFGTLTIDASLTVGDFFSVNGSLSLTSEARTVTLADGSTVETAAFQIGGDGLSAFAGIGGPYQRDSDNDGDIDADDTPNPDAVGLSLSNLDFGLAILAEANTSLDNVEVWTALMAEAGAVEFVGNDEVQVSSTDLRIEFNDAHNSGVGVDPQTRVVDFSGSPLSIPTGDGTSVDIDHDGAAGELRRAAGTLDVAVSDYVSFSGDVAVESSRREDVKLADESMVNVQQLTLAVNDVSVFAGLNGGTVDATGLQLSGVDLAVVLSTNEADGSNLGYALQAEAGGVDLLGVDIANFDATGSNFTVTLNRAGSGGELIDFADAPVEVVTGPASSVTFDLPGSAGELTEAGGTLALTVDDFLSVSGDFGVSRSEQALTLSDGSVVDADVLAFGASNLTAFAGVNAGTDDTIGITASGVDIGAIIATDQTRPSSEFVVVQASSANASLLGGEGVSATINEVFVEVADSSELDAVVDFSETPLVITAGGSNVTVDFDGSKGRLTHAAVDGEVDLFGAVQASGAFSVRQSTGTITLTDGEDVSTDQLSIGATEASAFFGSNGGTPKAVGLSVSDVDFGYLLASDQLDESRQWSTFVGQAGSVSLVGTDTVSVSGSDLSIELSRATGDDAQIDFETSALSVPTGPGTQISLDLNADTGPVTRASGEISVSVDGFFQASGGFAFDQKVRELTLSDGDAVVADVLELGASGIMAFVGNNGGTDDAVGFTVEDVDFGLLLAADQDADRNWTALKASTGNVSFVGIDGVVASSSGLNVDINRATGTSTYLDLDDNPVDIATGPSTAVTLDLDGAVGELTRAQGQLSLELFDSFSLDGSFGFEKSVRAVDLSNGAEITADVVTLGARNVSAFAGFENGSDDQVGFGVDGIDVGLALMTDRVNCDRTFATLQASGGNATFSGLDDLTVSASDLTLSINRGVVLPETTPGDGAQLAVADFSTNTLSVATGGDPFELNLDGSRGEVTEVGASLDLGVSNFATASGDFLVTFESQTAGAVTDQKLTISGTDVTAFAGNGEGTADETGIRLANGELALVAWQKIDTDEATQAAPTFAFATTGSASLVGVSGVTIDGNLTARVNYSGEAVDEEIPTLGGGPIELTFADGTQREEFVGNATFKFNGFVEASGDFSIVEMTDGDVTALAVQASDASAFLGSGRDTMDLSDDVGVELTNGRLDLRLERNAATDESDHALAAFGEAALIGVDGVQLSGSLEVQQSTFDESVTLDFGTTSTDDDLNVAAGAELVTAAATLSIDGFVDVSGQFGFERSEFDVDSTTTTRISLAGTEISAFLGAGRGTANEAGAELTDGQFAAVIDTPDNRETGFALVASGTTGIVGVDGLSLNGSAEARINRLGKSIDETIVTQSGAVGVQFDSAEDVTEFTATATLAIDQFVEVEGAFGFELSDFEDGSVTTTRVAIAGADVEAFLGVGRGTADEVGVELNEGRIGAVIDTPENGESVYALVASGSAAIVGVAGLTLAGDINARVNRSRKSINESISTPAGNVDVVFDSADDVTEFGGTATISMADFVDVQGSFGFELSEFEADGVTTSRIEVAATNVEAFLGTGHGTVDETGVELTGGKLGAVIDTPKGGDSAYALVASGEGGLNGVDGLSLSGTIDAHVNRLGTAIDETIATPGGDVAVMFDSADDVTEFGGTASLAIADFVEIEGAFGFELSEFETDGLTTSRVEIAASGVEAFLGSGRGTDDEFGVELMNGQVGAVIDTPETGESAYALVASGDVGLIGIDGLVVSGSVEARVNRLGSAIDETISTPAGDVAVMFDSADDVTQFGGTANLVVDGVIEISGAIGFEKSEFETDGVTTTRIEVAAAGVEAFLGVDRGTDDEIGVELTNGQLGAVIDQPEDSESVYALVASGAAGLVGVEGLSLSGSIEARVNRLGSSIDEMISTPAGNVSVQFESADDVTEFGGTVALSVADFVDVEGSFGFELDGDTVIAGVSGVNAFLGANAGTDDAIGLQVSDANLGLVLRDGAYALSSAGDVGFVGLPGLDIDGSFSARANRLGTPVNETVNTPVGPVTVQFDNGDDVLNFGGVATVSVADVFVLSGEINATETDTGTVLVDVPDMSLALTIDDLEVFDVGGGGSLQHWWSGRVPDAGHRPDIGRGVRF